MKNPCRELRELLGVNQVEFSRLIDRSMQSVRAYEKHPEDIPSEVIDRIRTLAAENGHADWAVPLLSDEWRVTAVFHPGETIITSAKPKAANTGTYPDAARLHAMLDNILASGDPDAIGAVVPNLELFDKWVTLKGKAAPRKGKRA